MANKKDNENKPKKTVVKADKESKKKVVELNPSNVIDSLEYLLELAHEEKIDCFVFAAYSKNDEIVTSVCDTTVLDHQALVAYLQSMATIRMLTEAIEITELE